MTNSLQLKEVFLTRYFSFEAIIGPLMPDMRAVFDALAVIYCMHNKEELDSLFALCNHDEVVSVSTKEGYDRTMRVLEYGKIIGRETKVDDSVMFALNCKGAAFLKTDMIQRMLGAKPNKGLVLQALNSLLETQGIFVYGIMSLMLFEGYIVSKDTKKAFLIADKCAKWNDIDSILTLIKYDKVNAENYLSILNAVLADGVSKEIYKPIFDIYSGEKTIGISPEAKLIHKFQCQAPGEKEKINTKVIRVAYSRSLSYEDKKRVLFSGAKELLASVNELPIDSSNTIAFFPEKPLVFCALQRKEEAGNIKSLLLKCQKNKLKCKPLLLVTPEPYVGDEYADAITNCYPEGAVERISAAHLSKIDFIPSKENFVISKLMNNNKANGVFIIKDADRLNDEYAQDLCKFLEPASKARYQLNEPHVTLDLSGCVFILTAGDITAVDYRIKDLCQIAETKELTPEEKARAINNFIKIAGESYELPEIDISDTVIKYLSLYPCKECESIIDEVYRKRLCSENKSTALSISELESASKKMSLSVMGFRIAGGRQ